LPVRAVRSSARSLRAVSDYNRAVIEEFRANAGRVGGRWEGRDLLLLTTKGRRSGRPHTTPIVYARDGDRLLVYASKGGAPQHPDWYLNLVANPEVTVEVGVERFTASATPLEGEERDRRFAEHADRSPAFAEYQARTDRVIPVVALERL
jgi:deazaflavin-dependent oxidoreductase (nitroreductase family)